jgi:cephalosporin hydroxylase
VWGVLNKRLPAIAPHVSLVNAAPAGEELSGYRFSRATAATLHQTAYSIALSDTTQPPLSTTTFAALFHHAQAIPGMCDHQKFAALCQIARHCPKGDVVEIGSWWGKSAFILSQLARQYRIGNLLCVDPWSDAHLVQGDEIVDATSATVSAEEAFQVFLMNLLPYNQSNINYIRAPSVDAAAQYVPGLRISTDAFGETQYQGKIALLHIDANHAYDAVNADTKAWAKFVIPGGWIIFDDYKWPYGDGPQRVADAFCVENAARIETAFFMCGTMFVGLKA